MNDAPRRRRPPLVGIVALALCLGVIGFAIVSISVGTEDTGQIEITGAQQTQSMLGGIPQDGPRLGSPDADVTVQVFNDMQCDPCSDWNRDVIVPLIRGPVRGGDLKLEFHHFLMTQSGYFRGTFGAVAAAKQDYEWQFIQLFFANQDEAEERGADQEFLDNIARGVGVVGFNEEQWQRDINADDVREALLEDEEFSAGRFPAEPAVVVVGPNGSEELIQSPSLAQIEEAISRVR